MTGSSKKQLAQQLATTLAASTLSPLEQEEWAVFSAYMSEKQVRELIQLLQQQTQEAEAALEELKSKFGSQ